MGPVLIAGLTFLTVTMVVVALWWAVASGKDLRARLTSKAETVANVSTTILRTPASSRSSLHDQLVSGVPLLRQLDRLTDQAGWTGRSGKALGFIVLFAVVGGVIGIFRTNQWVWGIVWAVAAGALPVFYLRYLRTKRLEKFSEQFPEALDMMTRALRTGYAVGPAFQMVAEEMPEPVAAEFTRISEQIALGRPTTECLKDMHGRIETEDVRFFYVAVGIQREVGGNLAEILEKLSEVIRERYKLLAFARVLSAQQKASAYCVAASPFATALLLSITSPTWFDPLWEWTYGIHVALFMLGLQIVGFFVLRRIANITV